MTPPSFEPGINCQAYNSCVKGQKYAWFTKILIGLLHLEMLFEMGFCELKDRFNRIDLTRLIEKACGEKAKAKVLQSAGIQSKHALLTQATTHLPEKVLVEALNRICTMW